MKELVCKDIKDKLNKIRYKRGKSHPIKYYPWVILFFICLPIFAFAQTQQQVLRELHRQQVPCAKIVLAQARLESGNFKSDFYKKTNNLFGIKKNGKYVIYKRWQDSVTGYNESVAYKYDRKVDRTYYDFLRRIDYAKDKEYEKKLREITK